MIEILFLLPAEVPHMIEEKPGEEADTDAQFQDLDYLRESPRFLGFSERRDENLGRTTGQRAVIVNNERNGRRVGNKCFVAALSQVLLAEVPFERFGERHEFLNDLARRLRLAEDVPSQDVWREPLIEAWGSGHGTLEVMSCAVWWTN
jgi:hypothetical protein